MVLGQLDNQDTNKVVERDMQKRPCNEKKTATLTNRYWEMDVYRRKVSAFINS